MADNDWLEAEKGEPASSLEGGSSAYLSAQDSDLDPHLFEGNMLRAEVATRVNSELCKGLRDMGLYSPEKWVKIWIAGSSISLQWSADRGNGDLDVLFGMDYSEFIQVNEDYEGWSEDQLITFINKRLMADLWPKTANVSLNGRAYEMTFYINPGTGTDITNIHPYAAYETYPEVQWVVQPIEVGDNPAANYPKHWFPRTDYDKETASAFARSYNQFSDDLNSSHIGSPGYHNAGASLNLVAAQASAMYDDIHHGRKEAFRDSGKGYSDWHNFRYQMAKKNGVMAALGTIRETRTNAKDLEETRLYGAPLEGADELIRRAMEIHRGGHQ